MITIDSTIPTLSTETAPVETTFRGTATYSPEDDKIRLYVGRVPRDEYEKLRADGWTSTPKQNCDFVATWTPGRRDTALAYAGIIDDEDQGPADRAADRAERFAQYREKRTGEALHHADRYDAAPSAHGYQSAARAERAAARHDRLGDKACDAWSKAEYWQRRTAGVISHALYKSTPAVRMGRIKILEAELRKLEKSREESAVEYRNWQKIAALPDPATQTNAAERRANIGYGWNGYTHPTTGNKGSLWSFLRSDNDHPDRITGAQAAALYFAAHTDPTSPEWNETNSAEWCDHYHLRLAYENQMCEAAGGRAALVEMIPGGFIGKKQIRKVVKSPVTGQVVSVEVMGETSGYTRESGYKEYGTKTVPVLLNIERFGADAYRPPTPEELTAFQSAKKAEKAAKPKVIKPPLLNPTDADADRLQALWNERAFAAHCESNLRRYGKDYAADFKPSTVCRITQVVYSANSKGDHSRAETKEICAQGVIKPAQYFHSYEKQAQDDRTRGPVLCQLRTTSSDGSDYGPKRVIILTDKPQKPLPATVWETYVPAPVTTEQTATINA